MRPDPIENVRANLEGLRMSIGRNRVNAKSRNTTPEPKKAAKYAHCVVLGMVCMDDDAAPVTPLATELKARAAIEPTLFVPSSTELSSRSVCDGGAAVLA
jgi:hypothetical protein